jgi:hypothetical protein
MPQLLVQDEQGLTLAALDDREVSPRYVGDFLSPLFCHLWSSVFAAAVGALFGRIRRFMR